MEFKLPVLLTPDKGICHLFQRLHLMVTEQSLQHAKCYG